MYQNSKKSSGLISMLLVFAMILGSVTPGFAQTFKEDTAYDETSLDETNILSQCEIPYGALLSEVTTPGALGYKFNFETGEIEKYEGTETEIIIPEQFKEDGSGEAVDVVSIGADAFAFSEITKVAIHGSIKKIGSAAFNYCRSLSEVTLSEGLEEIGEAAFANTAIETIEIPGTVTSFGGSIFSGTEYLEEATLKDGITEISGNMFNSSLIKKINIPGSVETIGEWAFANCSNLNEVNIQEMDEGNVAIGNMAFYNCTSLETITIPGSVKTIGNEVFYECTSLKNVTLKEGLKIIGESAFYGCASLEAIIIPGSVETIEESAFYDCTSLENVTLKEGLKEIKGFAFDGTIIKKITIPSTIEYIGMMILGNNRNVEEIVVLQEKEKIEIHEHAFAYRSGSDWVYLNVKYEPIVEEVKTPEELGYEFNYETGEITKYKGTETVIEIPERFKKEGSEETVDVVSIGADAFASTEITKVKIHGSIKKIGSAAFKGCKSLSEVTLSEGLEEIGSNAFNSSKLEEIKISTTVKKIGDYSFGHNTSLTQVIFNEESVLTEIGANAFNVTGITEIIIPVNVKKIGESVFGGCTALKKVVLNEGLKEIGAQAFNKTAIEEIEIPASVETLGKQAFSECETLKKAALNEGLTSIPSGLFSSSGVEAVNIPSTVRSIGDNAFIWCDALKSVNIPGNVKIIGSYAFSGCAGLSSVILNEGLEEIGTNAFEKTGIAEIIIPSTIDKIGSNIVNNNDKLMKIIVKKNKDEIIINSDAFKNKNGIEPVFEGKEPEDAKTPEESGYEFNAEAGEITKYKGSGSGTKIIIPQKFKIINGTEEKIVSVERIGEKAFKDNKIIKSVVISRGIKNIGKLAFDKCSNLEEVTLYDGLEKIEDGAFYETKLKEIEIPDTVNSIGDSAFYKCTELETVVLKPKNVINATGRIGKNAFEQTAVKKIGIPANIKTIGDRAFYNCDSLAELTLNSGLEEIGQEAFSKAPIAKVTLPGSVNVIGARAFYECAALKDVDIENGIREISEGLFGKTAIEEIKLPLNVRFIGKEAFSGTPLKKIDISGRVEVIGEEAFKGCTSLKEATVGEGVKEILRAAFSGTAIVKIEIPSTIEKIGAEIFSGNNVINSITVWNKQENIDIAPDAFPTDAEVTYKVREVPDEGENVIKDPIFKILINESLGRENLYTAVTKDDLKKITELVQGSALYGEELWKMESLEGIEHAEKLKKITLTGVNLEDLSPLKNLPLVNIEIVGKYKGNSEELKGEKSSLVNISPLGEIETLEVLSVMNTKLKDITSLSNLKNLKNLYLADNEISDVTGLKDIPISDRLVLSGNRILDFSVLKGKAAFNSLVGGFQRVTIVAESKLFNNPLKDENGNCFEIFDNDYVKSEGEKIRVLKMPEENQPVTVQYGRTAVPSTLTIKFSIADVINDPVLKKAVNLYRNAAYKEKRPVDQIVTRNELEELTEFNLEYISEGERKLITDISGLEYLKNLTELNLKGTGVKNLTPIGNLANLKRIFLGGSYEGSNLGYNNTKWRSPLSDIRPLAGLENLEDIYINDSEVVDISPLKDLKKISNLYLMRNKIEKVEKLKDIPIASGLYLQGNCISDVSPMKGKTVLKLYIGQSVSIAPDKVEFDNPLKDIDGNYVKLPANEDIANTGDKNEKLKVLKVPAAGNSIRIEYDIVEGGRSTLLTDISLIIGGLAKQQVSFKVLKTDGSTIDNAKIQVWNAKKEEVLNSGTAPYVWSLADGSYTYKASLEGYVVKEGSFEVKGAVLTVEVKMNPVETDNPGGGTGGGGGGGAPLPEEVITEPKPEEIPANLKSEKEIKLEKGSIRISPDTFEGKTILTAKEENSYLEITAVDEKGNKAEVKKPLFVEIKYDGQVKNPDNVTVVFTDENGREELVGGVYDANTGTVKFITNKLGKFTVREGSKEFSDTSEVEWAETAIEALAVKGIMNGKSADIFAPSDNITRAEFAALISRMMKLNENGAAGISFGDVTEDKWYYGSVAAVYAEGLINGKSGEAFDPDGNITRQEMAKIIGGILGRNRGNAQAAGKAAEFEDADSIADWAKGSVEGAVNSGVIVGIDGSFMPNKNATRAEAAVMLYRLYSLFMER